MLPSDPGSTAGPLAPETRGLALDVLRGVAVLGILLINIQGFAMVSIAMLNPRAYGNLEGANLAVFGASFVLADQEFMTLFAMLFAAGWVMIAMRIEAAGGKPLRVHLRRTLALLAIGALHGYLLFEHDILVPFAECALVLFPLRNLPGRILLPLGLCLYAVYSLLLLWQGLSFASWDVTDRVLLTMEWNGHPDTLRRELFIYGRASWLDQVTERAPHVLYSETVRFLSWAIWRIGGVMLIGLGLYRLGILHGAREPRFYAALAALGLGLGLTLRAFGLWSDFQAGFSIEYSRYIGRQWVHWGSLLSALGYLGLAHRFVHRARATGLEHTLACVGRLSLTNYVMQSAICTAIFYSYGLGWFGTTSRVQQLGVVLAVWAFQIAFSRLWLTSFRFGPLETVWRALSYGGLRRASSASG